MFSEHILTNHDSLCLKFALIVENYPIFIVISGYTVSHTHTYSVIHSPYNFGWLLLCPPLLVASPGQQPSGQAVTHYQRQGQDGWDWSLLSQLKSHSQFLNTSSSWLILIVILNDKSFIDIIKKVVRTFDVCHNIVNNIFNNSCGTHFLR